MWSEGRDHRSDHDEGCDRDRVETDAAQFNPYYLTTQTNYISPIEQPPLVL